ncbi:hypothetical protein Pla52n_60900 [Stieleria varia]|uniref:Uncharacterized protein n=1 Tax=Stieleria varia TaxID=2528005 RepID=A0A5C6A008_9BACT|nr:hypothetical protein Pla52n_60900 [Stieleria varia]
MAGGRALLPVHRPCEAVTWPRLTRSRRRRRVPRLALRCNTVGSVSCAFGYGSTKAIAQTNAGLLKVWCCVFLGLRKFMSQLPAQLVAPVSLRRWPWA